MGVSSFFSSVFSTVYADEDKQVAEVQEASEPAEEAAAEEEEEEPEDELPALREECQSGKCAALAKHFEHCQEKVQSGQGFKGEDCVEELCTYLVIV
ncbi:hypothetical protein ONZ45_g9068 [Pleurotus djamor]|nr:hypothetical protein ONZ45_g9068 [Pleurotus djamor]